MFFAVSAVTGAGLNTLMLAVGEQVAKLRAELAVSDEPVDLRDEEWERRRLQREKRFRIVQEEPGAFRERQADRAHGHPDRLGKRGSCHLPAA